MSFELQEEEKNNKIIKNPINAKQNTEFFHSCENLSSKFACILQEHRFFFIRLWEIFCQIIELHRRKHFVFVNIKATRPKNNNEYDYVANVCTAYLLNHNIDFLSVYVWAGSYTHAGIT